MTRATSWWKSKSRYMKEFYVGSAVAVSMSVGILLTVVFVVEPPPFSNALVLWAFAVSTPIGIMGWIASWLGRRERGSG